MLFFLQLLNHFMNYKLLHPFLPLMQRLSAAQITSLSQRERDVIPSSELHQNVHLTKGILKPFASVIILFSL